MTRIPSLGPRGEGWVVGQLVLLWAIVTAAWVGGADLSPGWLLLLRVIGAGVVLVALVLIGLGIRELKQSMSVLPRPKADGLLVQGGPYRWLRHPIYSGVIAAGLGASIYSASWIAGLATLALAVWFDLKARREEAWLAQHYPEYAAYAARTRRFIPGLY